MYGNSNKLNLIFKFKCYYYPFWGPLLAPKKSLKGNFCWAIGLLARKSIGETYKILSYLGLYLGF